MDKDPYIKPLETCVTSASVQLALRPERRVSGTCADKDITLYKLLCRYLGFIGACCLYLGLQLKTRSVYSIICACDQIYPGWDEGAPSSRPTSHAFHRQHSIKCNITYQHPLQKILLPEL